MIVLNITYTSYTQHTMMLHGVHISHFNNTSKTISFSHTLQHIIYRPRKWIRL